MERNFKITSFSDDIFLAYVYETIDREIRYILKWDTGKTSAEFKSIEEAVSACKKLIAEYDYIELLRFIIQLKKEGKI